MVGDFERLLVGSTREHVRVPVIDGESVVDPEVWADAVVANYNEDYVPGEDTYLQMDLAKQRERNITEFDAALARRGYRLASRSYRSYVILPPCEGEGR
jgi:hypothetical protein